MSKKENATKTYAKLKDEYLALIAILMFVVLILQILIKGKNSS